MKKVVWGEGQYTSAVRPGHYRSYAEFLQKAEALRAEQELAKAYLSKALPAMTKLLEIRLANREALTVMRPLSYKTSCLQSEMQDDLDKSFYNNSKNPQQDKFIDVVKTINPGTQLVLKALDPTLREFIFEDGMGKEHAISFDDRNALMTQTDVFEVVRQLFENKGE